jgi:amino acid transporter
MTTVDGPATPGGVTTGGVEEKGLKTGALGFVSSVVIGVASTAPGYSLAATLGFVTAVAGIGFHAPIVFVLAFVPMYLIALAFKYMNQADPDCGTTFTWAARAFGPMTGWLGGWGVIVADVLVMASLSQIAGSYTFLLFGATHAAASTFWVGVAGVVWILLMSAICYVGVEMSARTQYFLLAAEVVTLAVFAVVAFVKVYTGHPAGAVHPSWDWLNPFSIGSVGALTSGMLLAIFIYWGWDTAVSVNEETEDATRTPGRAAVVSTFLLLGIYLFVSLAAQAFHGVNFLNNNQDDVLSALGKDVLGSPWDKLLIIAVLTSASASTQTTILPATRQALSMAAHGAFPKHFGRINTKYLSPGVSTIWMAIVSIVCFVVLNSVSTNILGDSVTATGFAIAFYYGLTGFACTWYYRKELGKSLHNLIYIGLAPFVGGVILTVLLVDDVIQQTNPANTNVGKAWLGVGPPVAIGAISLVLGVVLMLIQRFIAPDPFFRWKTETADPAVLEAHQKGSHA